MFSSKIDRMTSKKMAMEGDKGGIKKKEREVTQSSNWTNHNINRECVIYAFLGSKKK